MSKESGPEQYIPIMKEKGLNEFPREYRSEMVRVFGAERIDLGKMISGKNIKRTRRYLESPTRQVFEQLLGALAYWPVGAVASRVFAHQIEKIDGSNGKYILSVGFPGKTVHEVKIRTYQNGTDRNNKHFEGVNYLVNGGYASDRLIDHPLPKMLRKTGLDEVPQLRAVGLARMALVGLRGYTKIEREDLEIMFKLVDNRDLENTDEVKEIVKNHHHFIRWQYLKPAIVHPRACLKISTAISRLYGDLMYTFLASPRLDWTIFVNAMLNREKAALFNGVRREVKSEV